MNLNQFTLPDHAKILINMAGYVLHFYSKDVRGKYLEVNDNVAINFRFNKPEHMCGINDNDLFPKQIAAALKNNDTKVMSRQEQIFFVESGPVENINYIAMSFKKPLYSLANKIIGITGISFVVEEGKFYQSLPVVQTPLYKNTITTQEINCLYLLIQGKTAKEIAKKLSLSHRTVEQYLNTCKVKLNCFTKSQLIEKSFTLPIIRRLLIKDLFIFNP